MSILGQTEPIEQKIKNQNPESEEPKLSPRQQRKQDALELAELIYDIYKESESSATIHGDNIKDNQNV